MSRSEPPLAADGANLWERARRAGWGPPSFDQWGDPYWPKARRTRKGLRRRTGKGPLAGYCGRRLDPRGGLRPVQQGEGQRPAGRGPPPGVRQADGATADSHPFTVRGYHRGDPHHMTTRQAEARRRLDLSLELVARLRRPIIDPDLERQLRRKPIALDKIRHSLAEWTIGVPSTTTEAGSGDGPAAWCWTHEQEVTRCHADDQSCTGTPLSGPSDRTGEQAVHPSKDQAADLSRRLDALLRDLLTVATGLGEIAHQVLDPVHHQGEKGCDLCRIKLDDGSDGWSPVHVRSTTLDGLLSSHKSVCQFHYRFARKAGRLPNRAEVKQHLAGERVTIPKQGART